MGEEERARLVAAMDDGKSPGGVVLVAGFGSPHGDDQAGWRVIEILKARPELPVRAVAYREATNLIADLNGCDRLIVVDACRSGDPVGTLTRLTWPDPRIDERHSHSTHGVDVCCALRLAERLGWLPAEVEIFGIEIRECEPGHELTYEVLESVVTLADLISTELCEAVHA
jgi:hydrogenase maturation protease